MNILAIGHDASRTGAPQLLVSYLRWLASSKEIRLRCLLGVSGPLFNEYQSVCDTRTFEPEDKSSARSRVLRGLGAEGWISKTLLKRWLQSGGAPELVYVSTVAALPVLQRLENVFQKKFPTVVHVHELESLLRQYRHSHSVGRSLSDASHILAASQSVKKALMAEFDLQEERIQVINEWLCRAPSKESDRLQARKTIREKLKIAPKAFVSLSVGTHGWRKAPELIAMLAKRVQTRYVDIHFVWVGGDGPDGNAMKFILDAERLGVIKNVHFLGALEDPTIYYQGSDCFSLVSREDPYPLAMLEAAAHGLPVLCFDQSGGAPEFVSDDKGIVVPYLDLDAFSDAIVRLRQQPDIAKTYGEAGRRIAIERHSLESTAPQILNAMLAVLNRKT